MPTNEAELLRRAGRGDAAARTALVDLHQPMVFSIARHMLGREEETADVFQTVFLRLFEHLGDVDPARGAAGWLRRTTVNECFDRIRARRSSVTLEGNVDVAGTLNTPVEAAQGRETGDAVRQALEKLSPEHRATVVLHYTEGLSYREISEVLNVSVETVRSRLKRARAQLRKRLRDHY